MRRVENEPVSEGHPRGPESTLELPARARAPLPDHGSTGDEQVPTRLSRPRSAQALRVLWVLLLVGLAGGLGALRTFDGPMILQQTLAAALGVVLAIGLSVRSGTHVLIYTALALAVGVCAVVSQWAPLLAGAAVGTGVLAACLGVLGTRPAPTVRAVVLEVVLALLVASVGGLAAAGFSVDLDTERFAYTVLVLAMAAVVLLVHRLGGGLHGLGRRGLVLGAVALALLVVVLVYTAALTRYGSPDLVQQVRAAQEWTREHLGGVPHPVEVIIGIPALAWGVSLRSRRRQGWWVCVFGVAATAAAASRPIGTGTPGSETALSALYSVVLGLLLGFVVIRLERLLTGRGGRRGQAEQLTRLEPSRWQPLH